MIFTTIFSGIPKGVSIRRLDDSKKASMQGRPYKWTAWMTAGGGDKRAYGNSIREALKNLDQEPTVEMR